MMRRTRIAAGALVGLVAGLATVSVRRIAIAESSMEPALRDGDFVVATRIVRLPPRGAVVTFAHPYASEVTLVKRLVGLPGEVITVRDGAVHVDDAILDDPWGHGLAGADGGWMLGDDEVFVLSDNRTVTLADSRGFGPVPRTALEHRVRWRYWPRLGAVDRPRAGR